MTSTRIEATSFDLFRMPQRFVPREAYLGIQVSLEYTTHPYPSYSPREFESLIVEL
jgi:hypothetical protein